MSKTALISGENYLSIGAELRARRQEKDLSLSDVSINLKIQKSYLVAIENLDKQSLPSIGYVLGFVRTYARFLDVDGQDAATRFKIEIECPENLGIGECPHHVPKRKIRISKDSIAIGLVLSSALAMVTWYGTLSNASSEQNISTPLEVSVKAADVETLLAHSDVDTITLKAVGPSWVEVKDRGGMVLISRIMVPGEIFEMSKEDAPMLSLRDAGAIELYIGGTRIGLIGQSGATANNIPLVTAAQ